MYACLLKTVKKQAAVQCVEQLLNLEWKQCSYHFFSGIGLGTVLTLQGTFGAPLRFLPSTVPTRVNGRITKITMLVMATCMGQIK